MGKHKMGERQIARILALIANEPLSQAEISKRLHISKSSVNGFIKVLLAEKPRRLYIAGWSPSTGKSPIRLLQAGRKPDEPYIRIQDRRKVRWQIERANRRRAEVLALLAMPQTARQLAARMGIRLATLIGYVREHRAAGRIHIKGWILPIGTGSQSPVYALGNAPDKERVRRSRERAAPKPAAAWAPMLTTLLYQPSAQDHIPQAA